MADRIGKELSRDEFADYLATMAAQLHACNQSSKRGEKKQRSRKTKTGFRSLRLNSNK